MTALQELLARAAVAPEESIRRAIVAMDRAGIDEPFAGFLRVAEIQKRYSRPETGRPASRSTVYRKMKQIGAVAEKKIGGESYFREEDVVRAFDPGALEQVG